MISDFGGAWATRPIERWLAVLLRSGILFWTGGVLAGIWHFGYGPLLEWFNQSPKVVLFLILFGVIMTVVVFASLLKRFDFIVLRFLEGYWPWPRWLRILWVRVRNRWIESMIEKPYQKLANKPNLNAKEAEKFVWLDGEMQHLPKKAQRLPTRLGNLLRAMELHPQERYGLDFLFVGHVCGYCYLMRLKQKLLLHGIILIPQHASGFGVYSL